jgi:RNA polymerase-associated protein LEO1
MNRILSDDEDSLFGKSDEDKKPIIDIADDLFGDDGSDQEQSAIKEESQEQIPPEEDLFGEDSDVEPIAVAKEEEVVLEASLPDLGGPKNNPDLFLLKLPNFLTIDSKPFDADLFRSNLKSEEEEDDVRMALENTIRWRHGEQVPESNARLVRWKDNTFSLLVGEEMFDVGTMQISERNQYLTTQHPQDQFIKTQSKYK